MTPSGRIVVGVDGDGSRAPLHWAVAEAIRRQAELDVVHAFQPAHDISPIGIPGPALDTAPYEGAAKLLVDGAVASIHARERSALRDVQRITVPDSGGVALTEASKGADLLVVGQRGRGPLKGLLGSVSHQCVHHAACPVTVVPADWPSTRPPLRIVVGVDGSDASRVALRWALEEAALWGSTLVVACAWNTPYPVEPWGLVVTPRDRDVFERHAHDVIETMVAAEIAEGAPKPIAWTGRAIEDASGPGLVQVSDGTDLLVVGSRGRGGFAALLVGSTSLHCLHHAACPVTIVPKRAAS
jgi:nucleotide-binding universal stress UspA family protein